MPAIVDGADAANHLLQTSTVSAVFELMRRASIALVGIGEISPRATVFRHGVIPAARIEKIAASGAVGTICGWFYGADGKVISTEFDQRTLSVAPAVLKTIPTRVGVAMHAAKARAVRGAIAGGWVNAVGLDAETADELLKLK